MTQRLVRVIYDGVAVYELNIAEADHLYVTERADVIEAFVATSLPDEPAPIERGWFGRPKKRQAGATS